jgi:nucleoside-diphosphate-sugar epimerase
MNSIIVTGANGFVGRCLCRYLSGKGKKVFAAVRAENSKNVEQLKDIPNLKVIEYGDITDLPAFNEKIKLFPKVDAIVHLAARVHVMKDNSENPANEFRKANVEVTKALANYASQIGCKRFIFLSTIKVNGESTDSRPAFTESDIPSPKDPYGISKHEAEKELKNICSSSEISYTIIRPPLIYGPDAKGNLKALMKTINKRVPLPLGGVKNKRSLVGLENLCDFILTTIESENAKNETFLIADGEDISTAQLATYLSIALTGKKLIYYFPLPLMRFFAKLLGKENVAKRLFGNLELDTSKATEKTGWSPPCNIETGLQKMAESFLKTQEK